ncbi:MAG: ATPase [[Candidatus Thermochlorobacteriaceae] bacterium GBChlB]|nr:MAG: ATPase [[Candidatus Thermochlorobacteriaceae] bacterium GBChlB]
MSGSAPLTVLCLASYEKGQAFMRECKRQGCCVILLTSKSLEHADWPRESLHEIFYIPDVNKEWNKQDVIYGVSYMARMIHIDKIVPLDDFDVEMGAALREHLRIGGMGETTARYFRDKLAMRVKAQEDGIAVPEFVHILNHHKINEYISRVPAPWVVKPRMQASSLGIKKAHSPEELWHIINALGDRQSFHLLERYVAGNVYHVDSIVQDREVIFSIASQYGKPPMDVAHQGAVFTTKIIRYGSDDEQTLLALNKRVLKSMGHVSGVSHTEFIKGGDGQFYFLETSARVGGANIVELVEAATGINLWEEWAKLEIQGAAYRLPQVRKDYAGLLVSLAKQEYPDTSAYNDSEVYWRMKKLHHVGLVVRSPKEERIDELMQNYTERFYHDFFASHPAPEKPSN